MAQSDRREIQRDNLGMVFRAQEQNEYAEESPVSKEVCMAMSQYSITSASFICEKNPTMCNIDKIVLR